MTQCGLSAQYFHSVSATDNYVKCPCNNFIKRHFNQYFVNNNNNSKLQRGASVWLYQFHHGYRRHTSRWVSARCLQGDSDNIGELYRHSRPGNKTNQHNCESYPTSDSVPQISSQRTATKNPSLTQFISLKSVANIHLHKPPNYYSYTELQYSAKYKHSTYPTAKFESE